jgi:sec-independent protein translocase protein TatB
MFGIGSTELIVILIVALIVIGPAKLPEMAKALGKALGEFRRVSTDVKRTIDQKARTEQAKKELFPETAAAEAQAKPAEAAAGEAPASEKPAAPAAEPAKDKA